MSTPVNDLQPWSNFLVGRTEARDDLVPTLTDQGAAVPTRAPVQSEEDRTAMAAAAAAEERTRIEEPEVWAAYLEEFREWDEGTSDRLPE